MSKIIALLLGPIKRLRRNTHKGLTQRNESVANKCQTRARLADAARAGKWGRAKLWQVERRESGLTSVLCKGSFVNKDLSEFSMLRKGLLEFLILAIVSSGWVYAAGTGGVIQREAVVAVLD